MNVIIINVLKHQNNQSTYFQVMSKHKNVSNQILHRNMTILAFTLLIFTYIMKSKSLYVIFYDYVTLVKYERYLMSLNLNIFRHTNVLNG